MTALSGVRPKNVLARRRDLAFSTSIAPWLIALLTVSPDRVIDLGFGSLVLIFFVMNRCSEQEISSDVLKDSVGCSIRRSSPN